jgi:hypothetical protein
MVEAGKVYVDRVRNWFDIHFPGQTMHVNRGIAATTSNWAAACIDTTAKQVCIPGAFSVR